MRILRSLTLAIACLAVLAGPIHAQTPVGGAVREFPPGTKLTYKLGGTYPGWVQGAIGAAAADFSDEDSNNSKTPTFSYSTTGSGTFSYSAAVRSPCGTQNSQWLQCASGFGSSGFKIYIRDFVGAPVSNWTWCNIKIVGTCWDAERALLHELEHVALGVAGHDGQGESNTIMGAISPAYDASGWDTHHIQRCDQAAAQLLYGVSTPFGKYPDCFKGIPRSGKVGLMPGGYIAPAAISVCLGQPAVLTGRTALINIAYAYKALADTPLAGRTIWFDRKPQTSSVWTLKVASTVASAAKGVNWSRSFTTSSGTAVTYQFRPNTDTETGVDPGQLPPITVTWRVC